MAVPSLNQSMARRRRQHCSGFDKWLCMICLVRGYFMGHEAHQSHKPHMRIQASPQDRAQALPTTSALPNEVDVCPRMWLSMSCVGAE